MTTFIAVDNEPKGLRSLGLGLLITAALGAVLAVGLLIGAYFTPDAQRSDLTGPAATLGLSSVIFGLLGGWFRFARDPMPRPESD